MSYVLFQLFLLSVRHCLLVMGFLRGLQGSFSCLKFSSAARGQWSFGVLCKGLGVLGFKVWAVL